MISCFFRKQNIHRRMGGILLGTLFASAGALPYGFSVDADRDTELLIMIGSDLLKEVIADHLIFLTLNQLLKRGFVVAVVQLLHRHMAEDKPADEAMGNFKAAVNIAGRNNGLHRIGQNGSTLRSPALRLAVSQQQVLAQSLTQSCRKLKSVMWQMGQLHRQVVSVCAD